MKKIILGLGILAMAASASAQESITLSYASNGTSGYGDAGGNITPWVTFTPRLVDIYAGATLSAITIEIDSKASNVSVYIKHNREDETPLYTQKVGKLEAGVHTIDLDTPYTLSEGETISIGYKAAFSRAGGALYGGPKTDEGCHAYYNTKSKWIEVNGSFCIGAVLTGDALPQCEAGAESLSEVVLHPGAVDGSMTMTIRNYGLQPVSELTYSYAIDGGDKVMCEYTFETPVATAESAEVPVIIPAPGVGRHEVTVEIETVNGADDVYKSNNTCTQSFVQKDELFIRRIVCEEVTGTWCSWCPRGIVGLEMMEERYPGEFIGYAVHSCDEMAPRGFDILLGQVTSLPGSMVDRAKSADPYDDIESVFRNERAADTYVGMRIQPVFMDGTVTVTTSVYVDKEVQGRTLNFAFVVIEDQILGMQQNAYSGGGQGEMGGWEDLPSPTPWLYNDIARAVMPQYTGDTFLAEETLMPDQVHEFEYSFALPTSVANVNNTRVIGLVLDKSNGFILNADRAAMSVDPGSVQATAVQGAEVLRTDVYSIDGRLLETTAGRWNSDIHDGRIVIVREHTADGPVVRRQILK